MKKLISISLIVFGFCCPGDLKAGGDKKKENITTQSSVIYALPATALHIEVVVEKTILKRGPFADYSEKYMGIQDVVTADDIQWKIRELKLAGYPEIDPQQFYKIRSVENYEPNLISLTPEGFIKGFNVKSEKLLKIEEEEKILFHDEDIEIEYGMFSINRNLKVEEETTYKEVRNDTAFIKVPALKKQVEVKTLEEKAEEAAHQIFKLRKRRFKILTSNFEVLPPDGKAYEIIVKELGELENEYLSLFIGKKVKINETYHFTYIPKEREKSSVLFRFSPQEGIVDSKDATGRSIIISLEDLQVTRELAITRVGVDVSTNPQIYYRIPGKAKITIANGKYVLLQKEMTIAQFGKIAHMPANVLLHEGYSIEFYPEYGAVKSISKQ